MEKIFTPIGIQKDIFNWFVCNFAKDESGNDIGKDILLAQQTVGMIEEIGELSHSILKLQQGIRKNENHLELLEDSVGDIIIFSANLLSLLDINMEKVLIRKDKILHNPIHSIFDLNINMSNLIEAIFDYDTSSMLNEINFWLSFDNENNINKDMVIFPMSAIYETLEAILEHYNLEDGYTVFVKVAEKVLKRDWNKHRQDNTEVN